MKALFCKACDDLVTMQVKKRKCYCGSSSGNLIDGVIHFSGDNAVPMEMPESFFVSPEFVSNNYKKKGSKKSNASYNEDHRIFAISVLTYLNEKADTSYSLKYPSSATQDIVNRKKEHDCSLQDFYNIIDKKVSQWKGTDFEIYLRPATLFSKKKFENYLGESKHGKSNPKTQFQQFTNVVKTAAKTADLYEGGNTDAQP